MNDRTGKMGRLGSGLLVLILVLTLVPGAALTASAQTSELFLSEYIEGSSYNKALEIYNGTGAAVNLEAGGYSVQIYFNGSTTVGLAIDLTGTVADGDVFVVTNASAVQAIKDQADQITTATNWYNGDDAVVLRKGTTILDVIGQVGVDPGSEWSGDGVGTQNRTLRRKAGVCSGDNVGTDAFDPSLEWDGFDQDEFGGLGAHTADCGAPPQGPKINEFSASTTGTDVEWVEVYGDPSTDYSAFTILEIEGDGSSNAGAIDEVIAVGTTDSAGFWLGNLPANALENGTITLLLVEGFTGALGEDLDTDNDGSFDSAPWDAIADAVAVNDGGSADWTYGVPALGPNYDGVSSFAPGGASRIPDGYDTDSATDWVRNDFNLAGIPGYPGSIGLGEAYNTPGAPNQIYVPPPEQCGDPFTPIYEIQGNGSASALDGNEVATEGIVVGDFQVGGKNGFYIQDEWGDSDAATSDGIFVYSTSPDVGVGDKVRVRGVVDEYYALTEITSVSQVWSCGTGTIAPTVVYLPVSDLNQWEPYEGMLVTFPQALYISEYYNFDRYGEIVLTSERQFQPTAVYEPGSPEAEQLALDNLRGRITLDDGRTWQNPDPAIHPNGLEFALGNLFRGGDTVSNVTGVVDYYYSLYRIQPTQGADHVEANPRSAAPDDVGGNLKVASFNVLNYFTTIDTGGSICGPAGDQGCRGADTPEEFQRQRAKIIAALSAINADVVGLIEIENNPGDVPVADLVGGLNDLMGDGTYDYIATGAMGTDVIRQALIYKPATVSPLGGYAVLDDPSFTDPLGYDDQQSRPALAQSFMDNATGGVFTAVVNHLKSKNCYDYAADEDLNNGQGCFNATRALGAQALVDWLATDPTGSEDADVLIIGDVNAYDKEDPVDVLLAGGYTDLVHLYQGEYAYSYVFDGQLGYLDHAANNAFLDEVTGTTVWHINADEPDLIDYDMSYKQDAQDEIYAPNAYRSSDHDPVIVGLDVCDEIPPTLDVSVSPDTLWPANHKYVDVTATVVATDNFDPSPTITLVSVTSNEPDDGLGDGDTPEDIILVDDFTFQLRAERAGTGEGRIYTITYQATDACGNSTEVSATVTVPHDKGTGKGKGG